MSKTRSIVMVALFMASLFVPIAHATGQTPSAPVAYLKEWDAYGKSEVSNLKQVYLSPGGAEPYQTHDIDSEGSLYLAYAGDHEHFPSTVSPQNYNKGISVTKMNSDGTHNYTIKVTASSSSYCQNINQPYCRVVGLYVTGVDQFYLVINGYRMYNMEFNNPNDVSAGSGYSRIVAYYNQTSWQFQDVETSAPHYFSTYFHTLDEFGNLLLMNYQASGTYNTFEVAKFSPSGSQWSRSLEIHQNTRPRLQWDTVGSDIHILIMSQSYSRYDSQTLSCSTPNSNYCYHWIKIDSNGIRQSTTHIDYVNGMPTAFEVLNNSHALIGGYGSNENLQYTNYVTINGTTYASAGSYTHWMSSVDTSGNWGKVFNWKPRGSSSPPMIERTVFVNSEDNINVIIPHSGTEFDGVSYPSTANGDVLTISVDIDTGVNWVTKITFDNYGGLEYYQASDELLVMYSAYSYNTSTVDQTNAYTYSWINQTTGEVVFTTDEGCGNANCQTILGVTPEDGLYVSSIGGSSDSYLSLLSVDEDADGIGTGDNCPDTYNPQQLDYDLDGEGDMCDDDDDNDGVKDFHDSCELGALNWESESATDWDADGCNDLLEDYDDDEDGVDDIRDDCPVGKIDFEEDYDGDGCKDSEDYDDDNDNSNDGSDFCSQGEMDWISGGVTDHDNDGCQDSSEDLDDDNDGIEDILDQCPKGEVGWPANSNTDFDGDGCKDGYEDEDDDGDGVDNIDDKCPKSVGAVDDNGCSVDQLLNNEGSGNDDASLFYVCADGETIVSDMSDCPEGSQTNENESNTSQSFFYVCPGGGSVVTDLADCPEAVEDDEMSISEQLALLLNQTNSENNTALINCPESKLLVYDIADCPGSEEEQSTTETSSAAQPGTDMTLVIMMGVLILISTLSMVLSLRKPTSSPFDVDAAFAEPRKEPIEFDSMQSSLEKKPPVTITGEIKDGFEWIEWPAHSGEHYYRQENTSDDWSRFYN